MMGATPSWLLVSSLPDHMLISMEFSCCVPLLGHTASVTPNMAKFQLFISFMVCASFPVWYTSVSVSVSVKDGIRNS